jgi:hypothetical protein
MTNPLGDFLMMLPYPLTGHEIVTEAESAGLDPDYVDVLRRIPDREYDTVADVAIETSAIA